jgi:hypothetical protein
MEPAGLSRGGKLLAGKGNCGRPALSGEAVVIELKFNAH